jgi:hypothetical protein
VGCIFNSVGLIIAYKILYIQGVLKLSYSEFGLSRGYPVDQVKMFKKNCSL